MNRLLPVLLALALAAVVLGCPPDPPAGTGGSAGTAGSGGSGGESTDAGTD